MLFLRENIVKYVYFHMLVWISTFGHSKTSLMQHEHKGKIPRPGRLAKVYKENGDYSLVTSRAREIWWVCGGKARLGQSQVSCLTYSTPSLTLQYRKREQKTILKVFPVIFCTNNYYSLLKFWRNVLISRQFNFLLIILTSNLISGYKIID